MERSVEQYVLPIARNGSPRVLLETCPFQKFSDSLKKTQEEFGRLYTRKQILEILRALEIKGVSNMNKKDLRQAAIANAPLIQSAIEKDNIEELPLIELSKLD